MESANLVKRSTAKSTFTSIPLSRNINMSSKSLLGIPISTNPRNTENGIRKVNELKLDAMELEFVRGVYLSKEKASEIKKIAGEENIILTCHAPYYINLNSNEKQKIAASRKRIINSAKIANLCGGWSVCFHPGFYMKQKPEKVYEKIKLEIKKIVEELKSQKNNIWVRPEVTGKKSQFGNLNELLKISQEIDNVMPCVDFSHLHARTQKNNSYEEFCEILELIEKKLGKEGLRNMHMHVSGIDYSEKGEKKHLTLENSDFKYKDLMKALKEFKVKGVLISESPNIEKDARSMKDYFLQLK